MDKEDKQIIERATKEEWRIGDRTRLKRLLEKNLKLYRENVELENKIADIKANCDLAIEGRDIKIKELEKEVEKHKWNDIFLEDCAGYDKKIAEEYTTLQERIKELEQQIEKMKCCQNCKYLKSLAYGEFSCDLYGECKHYSKWEIEK